MPVISPARDTTRKAAGYAADVLRQWIVDGYLSPGQRLIEPS